MLAQTAGAARVERSGCRRANQGRSAAGASLEKALWLAGGRETLCQQYAVARQIGTPIILSDDEIGATVERFRGYGLNAERPAAPETT